MSFNYHTYHPEQARAKWTVKNHVRRNKLIKPDVCERCEKPFKKIFIEAHHWSYKKKHHADVIWLCRWCHKRVHLAIGEKWIDLDEKPNYKLQKEVVTEEQRASAMAQEIY